MTGAQDHFTAEHRATGFHRLRVITLATVAGSLAAGVVFGVAAYDTAPGSPQPASTTSSTPSTSTVAGAAQSHHSRDDDGGSTLQPPAPAAPGSGWVVSGGSH